MDGEQVIVKPVHWLLLPDALSFDQGHTISTIFHITVQFTGTPKFICIVIYAVE